MRSTIRIHPAANTFFRKVWITSENQASEIRRTKFSICLPSIPSLTRRLPWILLRQATAKPETLDQACQIQAPSRPLSLRLQHRGIYEVTTLPSLRSSIGSFGGGRASLFRPLQTILIGNGTRLPEFSKALFGITYSECIAIIIICLIPSFYIWGRRISASWIIPISPPILACVTSTFRRV